VVLVLSIPIFLAKAYWRIYGGSSAAHGHDLLLELQQLRFCRIVDEHCTMRASVNKRAAGRNTRRTALSEGCQKIRQTARTSRRYYGNSHGCGDFTQ
jgi:hypothetical protein